MTSTAGLRFVDRFVVKIVGAYLGCLHSPRRMVAMTDGLTIAIVAAVQRTEGRCAAAAEAESDLKRAELARVQFSELDAATELRQ